MKTRLKLVIAAPYGLFVATAVMMMLSETAQAQITFSSSANLTAWDGSPVYTSIASASLSGATTQQTLSTVGTLGSYGVLAETFTPTTSFTLGSFAMLLSVNGVSNPTYGINLYDLGPAGTISVSASTNYTPGTSLFTDNTVTFSGATGGEVQGTFTLDAADQVTLNANEEYALEIWVPSGNGSSAFGWYRNPTATGADPGGQMFLDADSANARKTLNQVGAAGSAPRTATLALYAESVPEPSSIALIGGGIMLLGAIRRFKK